MYFTTGFQNYEFYTWGDFYAKIIVCFTARSCLQARWQREFNW